MNRYELVVLFRKGGTKTRQFRTIKEAEDYASDVRYAVKHGADPASMMYIADKDGSLRYKWELRSTYEQTYPR